MSSEKKGFFSRIFGKSDKKSDDVKQAENEIGENSSQEEILETVINNEAQNEVHYEADNVLEDDVKVESEPKNSLDNLVEEEDFEVIEEFNNGTQHVDNYGEIVVDDLENSLDSLDEEEVLSQDDNTQKDIIDAEQIIENEKETLPKKSWFTRLKEGLFKTSSKISKGIFSIFGGEAIDDETLTDFEDLLISTDLGYEITDQIIEQIKDVAEAEDGKVTADKAQTILKRVLIDSLSEVDHDFHDNRYKSEREAPLNNNSASGKVPEVILVVGVNGTGKTTTIGKLADNFRKEGKKVVLGGADTFRAAAIDQLKVWADRSSVTLISKEEGADPAGVAYDAIDYAQKNNADVVIIDTAGRLQNKQGLMDELKKIHKVIAKKIDGAPHHVILTLDATTGQNAISQVKIFKEAVDVTGIVMTKLDGTARGGILVAIVKMFNLPIHFIGVGEGIDDIEKFKPSEFVDGFLG